MLLPLCHPWTSPFKIRNMNSIFHLHHYREKILPLSTIKNGISHNSFQSFREYGVREIKKSENVLNRQKGGNTLSLRIQENLPAVVRFEMIFLQAFNLGPPNLDQGEIQSAISVVFSNGKTLYFWQHGLSQCEPPKKRVERRVFSFPLRIHAFLSVSVFIYIRRFTHFPGPTEDGPSTPLRTFRKSLKSRDETTGA